MAKNKTEVETNEAADRIKTLEDFLATMMLDLNLARQHLSKIGLGAGSRFNDYYQQTRKLLGARGDDIDASSRI